MFYERRLHATHEFPPHCCPVCCCCRSPCHAFCPRPDCCYSNLSPLLQLINSLSTCPTLCSCCCCLPATAAGCMRFFAYFNASLSMQLTGTSRSGCHWRWRWRWRRRQCDGDDSATRRCHRLQQLLKCSYNFYADSQRNAAGNLLAVSLCLPLSLALLE